MSVRNGIAMSDASRRLHILHPLKDGKQHKIEAQSYEELERTVLRFRLEQIVLVDATRADPESVAKILKRISAPIFLILVWTAPRDIRATYRLLMAANRHFASSSRLFRASRNGLAILALPREPSWLPQPPTSERVFVHPVRGTFVSRQRAERVISKSAPTRSIS